MYWQENDLEQLGINTIKKYPEFTILGDTDCRIKYLYCDKAKKSNGFEVYADTELVKEKYKVFLDADFIITFYMGNTESLDEKRMEILMYHELCHVGYDPGQEGQSRYRIIPHDIEDFRCVIKKWGLDWVKDGGQGTGKTD